MANKRQFEVERAEEGAPFGAVRPRAGGAAARPEEVPDGALPPGGPVSVHRERAAGARRVWSARRGRKDGEEEETRERWPTCQRHNGSGQYGR
jgi:hypothetical protein